MKTFTHALQLLVLLMVLQQAATAQDYEFVENKGQWDSKVKFKGSLANGAFFLQGNGYKILLNNPDDWQKVNTFFGGHSHAQTGNNPTPDGTTGHGGGVLVGTGSGNPSNAAARTASSSVSPTPASVLLHSHAYEVSFVGASANPQIIPDKQVEGGYNFFIGKDSSKWASDCKVYQAVLYKNVYPNIDVRYYTDNGNLKYDIIVNPGGNADDIALQFTGVDKLDIQKGNLRIRTSVGDVNEQKPYSYEIATTGRNEVAASYTVKGNIVRFSLGEHSASSMLVIDPTLIFSTFSGSSSDNWGFTATYDGAGNLYAGGIVFGNGYPVSTGAMQTSFGGGNTSDNTAPCDIAITKFNSTGRNRLYATLIGGNGNEQPHSMIVDNAGNLIIAGRTNSTNFPTTTTTYGPGGGDFDIFICKLNNTGTTLMAGRLFGGSGSDGVNILPKYSGGRSQSLRRNYGDDARSEVIVDAANNIYFTSQTSSSDFRTTTGAFQTSLGGKQDGVIIKTSTDLNNVLFSSYLGGTDDDAGFVLALHPTNGNIYVAGATASQNFPGTGNGAVISSTYGGGAADGFVSIINNTGTTLIKSSYFNTDVQSNDIIFGIQFDKFNYPYIMGTTTGSWKVVNAAFSEAGGKQFISKLKEDLSDYVYSTVFGPNRALPAISPTAFLVDRCENVYVSGWGGGIDIADGYENSGTLGLTTTSDALFPNSSGRDGADFYFFVLKKDAAAQLYGTMFGQIGGLGDHVDGGTSRFDKQGVIYQSICANCGGGVSFPTTAGAYSRTNGALSGRGCNLAAIKIAFNLAGVGSGLRSSINGTVRRTGCIPLQVTFTDTIAMGKQYIWDYGDGSPRETTTQPTTQHTYTIVGTYTVMLISIDSSACNVADTSYTSIKAGNNPATLGFTYKKLLPCDQLNYEFTNTSTAAQPFNNNSFVWRMGDGTVFTDKGTQTFTHPYASAGTYDVTLSLVDTNYCNYPDSITQQIRIAINVKAGFTTPASGCVPYTAEFSNTSMGGQTFTWDFGDGTTSTDVNPSHLYSTAGTYTIKMIAIDSSTCNIIDSTSFTITVSPNPTASFSYSPVQAKENTPFVFTNTSVGATSYLWDFGDGEKLFTIRRDTTVSYTYAASGDYTVCLKATNDYGCVDDTCIGVKAIINPLVDVPSAFTPNGDGINDQVMVRGYGISKMNFRIFNRWGKVVYQSTSYKGNGWNGYYNGVLQPMDVYAYVLDVEFSDGKRYQKRGDITLLR
ncbi:gliding motility-associated C-terminal domain-containing protein [Filimonas lacunae]|uniref:Gliding motility-associated C-terminal domain-containing protein n=1 Tax=Filimonas lacunae TaxID=477680 RepID=A0A173MME0_9BACT|nr:gliding motility-associated C-terminal domain-containing protein [Filimonas lacunae]BAV08571.1 cell surface protein [Filimonas lacunae]SIS57373.1 gliding motility-associated C-terminal domain-containing protein [Filimonas lacunae]